jgi:hypothetical protein
MSDSTGTDDWPNYLWSIPRADIMALGVIALNYGQLENALRNIFGIVSGMNEDQVASVFYRLPNNQRQNVLTEFLAKSAVPQEYHQPIRDFADAFKICAENRSGVMHAHSPGSHTSKTTGERGILLFKYSKAGTKMLHAARLSELRAVADEI